VAGRIGGQLPRTKCLFLRHSGVGTAIRTNGLPIRSRTGCDPIGMVHGKIALEI